MKNRKPKLVIVPSSFVGAGNVTRIDTAEQAIELLGWLPNDARRQRIVALLVRENSEGRA